MNTKEEAAWKAELMKDMKDAETELSERQHLDGMKCICFAGA
jgi:hypothetical protein